MLYNMVVTGYNLRVRMAEDAANTGSTDDDSTSVDDRRLGVRVYYAFLEPL